MANDTSAPPELESPTTASARPSPVASEADPKAPRTDDRKRIALRAYERYLSRGGESGWDQEDWFEAERELVDPND